LTGDLPAPVKADMSLASFSIILKQSIRTHCMYVCENSHSMSCNSTAPINSAELLRAYESRAASYSRLAIVQRGLANWLAEWLENSRIAAWQTALEFGAGDGIFTRCAAERYARYFATDISPRMVEQGRRQLPHVTWKIADAWRYEGPSVDRIFSSSLLQWCPEPARTLRQWRNITLPGARMLHGIYILPTLAEWYSLADVHSPLVWRTAPQWLQLFHEAGWAILRSECRTYVQEFPSGRDFIRFLRHTGATCWSSSTLGELRRRITTYEQRFPADDLRGGVKSTWNMFRVEVVAI
jgi:SAM-dependent methyltransferase